MSKPPKDFGPIQLAGELGLAEWQFEMARQRGLVPEPDRGRRWSAALARSLRERVAEIVEAVGTELPIGANRAAERLAGRTGLEVDRADVEELSGRGVLPSAGEFKGWPLYDLRQLDAVDADLLAAVVADRKAWLDASLQRQEAAKQLGWRLAELERVVAERGIAAGRFGRYARRDIEALAADEELGEQVAAERLIGPDQAAERLEVRRTDWDYAVAAGWIEPRRYISVEVGRYREVTVPLYRTADVDALLQIPGVDWKAVRACRPGDPSPLREHARRPPTRAQVVRAFCRELGDRYEVEVWAVYHGGADQWEVDWTRNADGQPSQARVEEAIAAHPCACRYRGDIRIDTAAGAAIRWARAMLEPGVAVILDTETTDLYGPICEIAVIDTDGEVLLDTLVNPGVPITAGARWVHGIEDADVVGAPSWEQVLPRLLEATAGRQVLAYNADYDLGVVVADARRHGLSAAHLADQDRWGCLMWARADWSRRSRRLPLGGGHRAREDALAALDVLRGMTTP